jgi:hypothetical protein
MFVLLMTINPISGSYHVVPLGGHNISMDFAGEDIAVIPMPPDYQECMGVSTYYAMMVDRGTNSSSFAYLIGHDTPRPIGDLEVELKSIMGAMCDEMSIGPYENGYISTGQERLGGQTIWGIIAPLDSAGENFTTCVEIVATFKNGSLNEHLVKNARL